MITQEIVDEEFKKIKAEWDKRVKTSGRTEQMYIVMDTTGSVAGFLSLYASSKESVEAQGLVMPELVKGLKVTQEANP